jgi:hypothetical protein
MITSIASKAIAVARSGCNPQWTDRPRPRIFCIVIEINFVTRANDRYPRFDLPICHSREQAAKFARFGLSRLPCFARTSTFRVPSIVRRMEWQSGSSKRSSRDFLTATGRLDDRSRDAIPRTSEIAVQSRRFFAN